MQPASFFILAQQFNSFFHPAWIKYIYLLLSAAFFLYTYFMNTHSGILSKFKEFICSSSTLKFSLTILKSSNHIIF